MLVLILVLKSSFLLLKAECVSLTRALAHDGHRPSLGDHRAWLGLDGGFGQEPWEGSRAGTQGAL